MKREGQVVPRLGEIARLGDGWNGCGVGIFDELEELGTDGRKNFLSC